MRTVKIQGGLGNQLFALAFAHSIRVLTGETVAVDLAAYGADRYDRGFVFRDLVQQLGGLTTCHRPFLAFRAVTALARRVSLPRFASQGAPPKTIEGLARLAARRGYFSGYWQDEAFIAAPEVFRAAARADLLARGGIGPAPMVAIHYRTYWEERHADRRAVPGPDYFRRCIASLNDRGVRPDKIVLISDDPHLALQRIGEIGAPIVVPPRQGPWQDMALLLRARHLILSNSSFSWWGGFCGDADTVFYPARGQLFHYPHPAARFEIL